MTRDKRTVVDELLAAEKRIAAADTWQRTGRDGEQRLLIPLAVGGEVTNLEMQITAYPNLREPKFTILLIFERCVWRLCFDSNASHTNPLNRPPHLPPMITNCSHYHSWEDNRPLGNNPILPKFLRNANVLPADITGFAEAFRWFCHQTNIVVSDLDMPELPRPDRLL